MRYLLAFMLLLSTQAYADRYLSDGNGGFYVYRDEQPNGLAQQMTRFGNRGGLLSRMEQNRQIQLQNQVNEQLLQRLQFENEMRRRQMGR